jgi:prophage antirepressor-like protein
MSTLQIFNFENEPMRIDVDDQGNVLFCAPDVCDI